jgi:hypothetical protein
MKTIPLKVTWKIIRRAGYGRTKHTYCTYVIENENHKHKLKTIEGTKLFEFLQNTVICHDPDKADRFNTAIFVDAIYRDDKLLYIKNPRIIK